MAIPSIIINKLNYPSILKDIITGKEKINLNKNFVDTFIELSELNSKKIILLGRARSAIYLSVKNLISKKKNKIILMSSFTVPEVIKLVIHAGGIPHFIDFSYETTFLNLEQIEKKMKLKPAAIIVTHYNLNQINYPEIADICKENNVDLIEDSALSINGKVKKTQINSLSDYSLFSFSSFKLLNFYYGGAIAVKKDNYNDIKELTKNWKILTFSDYLKQFYRTTLFSSLTNKFFFNLFTINLMKISYLKNNNDIIDTKLAKLNNSIKSNYFSLPPNYAISELLRKIPEYQNNRKHRVEIAKLYYHTLRDITVGGSENIKELIIDGDNFNYLIKCKNKNHRDELRKKLLQKNFPCGKIFYKNCHRISEFSNIEGSSKNVDDLVDKILVLPTHQKVNNLYAKKLINEIKNNY